MPLKSDKATEPFLFHVKLFPSFERRLFKYNSLSLISSVHIGFEADNPKSSLSHCCPAEICFLLNASLNISFAISFAIFLV